MILFPPIRKHPADTFTRYVDFSPWLAEGETIATQTVTSRDLADDADSTAALIQSNTINGGKVEFRLKENGGAANETHRLTIRYVSSLGNKRQVEWDVQITEE